MFTGGRSSAKVLKVTFTNGKQQKSFVVRIPKTEEDAEKEEQKVSQLNVDDSICFVTFFKRYRLCGSHSVIIYRDVESIWNKEVYDLSEYFSRTNHNKDDIEFFMKHFQNCMEYALKVYNRSANLGEVDNPPENDEITVLEHYENVRLQLPPDLIIVKPESVPSTEPYILSVNEICQSLTTWDEKKFDTKWIKFAEQLKLEYEEPISGEDNVAYMISKVTNGNESFVIWIEIKKGKHYEQSEIDKLVFLAKDMVTPAQKLNFESCISNTELRAILSSKKDTMVKKRQCHYDFHCGNVLVSNHYSVFIDLADTDFDLPTSDTARLHVSSWFNLSQNLKIFSKKNAEAILYEKPNLSSLSPISPLSTFHYFSGKLLGDIPEDWSKKDLTSYEQHEINLAYVIQILMFQRYSILDGRKIPDAFNVFASYWITRLCSAYAKTEINKINFVFFPPDKDNTVRGIVTEAFKNTEFAINENVIMFDNKLIQKIERAQEKNIMFMIMMDVWSLDSSDKYSDIMRQYDQSIFHNCALLITNVTEKKAENDVLKQIEEIFPNKIKDKFLFKITSKNELGKIVIDTIYELKRIISRKSKQVREFKEKDIKGEKPMF